MSNRHEHSYRSPPAAMLVPGWAPKHTKIKIKPAFRTLGQFPRRVFADLSFHDHSYPAAGARV